MADDFDPTTAPAYQEGALRCGVPAGRERTGVTVKKASGFKYGTATLVLLGFVSGGAQFVAASIFGIVEYFSWDVRSTGGLVAVIAGVITWMKCRSWESWRNWIWLPILITATLVLIYMGFTAQSIARQEAVIRLAEEASQAELVQACQAMGQQIGAAELDLQAQSLRERPSWATAPRQPSWETRSEPSWGSAQEMPAWATSPSSGADNVAVDELRAEYDASCIGVE
ncbi:hypothetical protein [Cryobacterium serini]|uniref:Uncharacterized protein n=1 Tax=Cryobacterium serini TaxID=1259201 RepID=A0A4R9BKH6_9MICO|nr:hypothetical protein [Cryobacterium serini]TFD86118.1 hypothetical protein E3T51_13350 [Cryobacterium serini]